MYRVDTFMFTYIDHTVAKSDILSCSNAPSMSWIFRLIVFRFTLAMLAVVEIHVDDVSKLGNSLNE
jgi:hypothetical protein